MTIWGCRSRFLLALIATVWLAVFDQDVQNLPTNRKLKFVDSVITEVETINHELEYSRLQIIAFNHILHERDSLLVVWRGRAWALRQELARCADGTVATRAW